MAGTMNKGTLDKGSLVKTFGGGGSSPTPPTPQEEYFVKVVDYDGTVIDEQWLDDGAEYTLPSAPSHEGLVFQEWCSTETITNGKITINKKSVMIGALYTTVSGQNEFDIELNAITGLSVTFRMYGTKDWGDGTTSTSQSHTYSEYGKYTIKCSSSTIENTSSSSGGFFGQKSATPNQYCTAIRFATVTTFSQTYNPYCFQYCKNLKYVSFHKNFVGTISSYAFQYCSALSSIILPATTINQQAFYNCYTLENAVLSRATALPQQCFYMNNIEYFVMPNAVLSLDGSGVFNQNVGLKKVYLSESLTNINATTFQACYSLTKIKIPKTVSSIGSSAFYNDYNLLEYDFSEHEAIPTLTSGALNGISAFCKIKVPSALYDQWITETGWSDYANYIVAV